MPSKRPRFFIDIKPEHIQTGVVPNHVQAELPFGDLAGIERGAQPGNQ